MKGTFTGVGVGPGDPELMTLKAIRAIRECSVIVLPVSDSTLEEPVYEYVGEGREETGHLSGSDQKCRRYLDKCVAYRIAVGACPQTAQKDRVYLPMPMIKDRERLKMIHDLDTAAVEKRLDEGENVVFLTLGDPTVYSTCMYVHKRLKQDGYQTKIIPGIPSFCAAAARLDIPLAENRQELHILPASYHIEESLDLPGTKILMKAGRKIGEAKRLLSEKELDALMVENCGMDDEKIYVGTEEIPEQAGYYSLLIVKEGSKSLTELRKGGMKE